MGLVLLLVAIVVPVIEIWTAVVVAHHLGWVVTIVLILLISACGPRLVRRQGVGVWRRAQQRLADGEVPGREATDGVLLLVAGGLLTFPGFITGILGALLLLAPVRVLVRAASGAWLARKLRRSTAIVRVYSRDRRPPAGGDGPVMADSHEIDRPPPELGPPGDR